jgi:hypothetical protein
MVKTHRFKKSTTYKSGQSCPPGQQKRRGYTVKKTGKYVPPRCISKLGHRSKNKTAKKAKVCPPGQIVRKSYVRKFSSAVRAQGFTVKRKSGTTYRVVPKRRSTLVRSACIKDRGLPGKGPKNGTSGIGPLKKGHLLKHGYVYRLPQDKRQAALKKAVKEYGPMTVYRRLNAVAKLAVRTVPSASRAFAADRNWIRRTFGPLKAT